VSPATHPALFDTFARVPMTFVRGEGAWLETTDGRRVLDFTSGIAVNTLGHAHPALVSALTEQANRLWHVSNLFGIAEQDALAEKLTSLCFADKAFFANSGAEAVECAIKTARRYHHANGRPERTRIVTFAGAFHGRTLATLAATGNPAYLEGFGDVQPGFDQVRAGDLAAVKAAVGPETAAIMIEPIQGEGGLREVDPGFLRALRALCDDQGLLLIFDEVQTGIARTGAMFAHQLVGVEPDIMTLAKGLGGGFPVGACLATNEAASGMTPGTHGSTFGGNPLAMAVASAVVDIVSEPAFLENVRRVGLVMKQRLAALIDMYPDVAEGIRGEGLLAGVKVRVANGDVVAALRDQDMLAVGAGENVVRLLPPLDLTDEDLNTGMERLEAAFEAIRAGLAVQGGDAP